MSVLCGHNPESTLGDSLLTTSELATTLAETKGIMREHRRQDTQRLSYNFTVNRKRQQTFCGARAFLES